MKATRSKKAICCFKLIRAPSKLRSTRPKACLRRPRPGLGKTELDVKRYAPLVKDRAISQEEYDDAVQADLEAKAAVLSAKAQVEQAQLNLGLHQNHLADRRDRQHRERPNRRPGWAGHR